MKLREIITLAGALIGMIAIAMAVNCLLYSSTHNPRSESHGLYIDCPVLVDLTKPPYEIARAEDREDLPGAIYVSRIDADGVELTSPGASKSWIPWSSIARIVTVRRGEKAQPQR